MIMENKALKNSDLIRLLTLNFKHAYHRLENPRLEAWCVIRVFPKNLFGAEVLGRWKSIYREYKKLHKSSVL